MRQTAMANLELWEASLEANTFIEGSSREHKKLFYFLLCEIKTRKIRIQYTAKSALFKESEKALFAIKICVSSG
jgi:hypothetical protein